MIQAIYDSARTGPWCTPYEIAVGTETTKLASCFTCTLFMYANGYPPSAIHLGQGASWVPFYEERPGPPVIVPRPHVPEVLEEEPLVPELVPEASEKLVSVGVISSAEDELVPLFDDSSSGSDVDIPVARQPEPYTYPGSANRYVPEVDSVIAALNERWRIECTQHLLLGLRIMKQNGAARVDAQRRPRIAVLERYLSDNRADLYVGANLILDAVTVHDGEVTRVIRTLAAG